MLLAIQVPDHAEYQMLINEEDYDASKHVLWSEKSTDASVSTPSPVGEEAETDALEQKLTEEQTEESAENLTPTQDRMAELIALYETEGFTAIKAIATPLGITKPDTGWEDAIPLIVEAEQL